MAERQAGARISRASAAAFRRHFWQPPRAHGEVIEARQVSFLELFYDLVYVVVVSQAARHLAAHVSWAALGELAVVFGLIWVAWVNGAVYHDLHGRTEGRTRTYVFAQMGVLALLAVFTSDATGAGGRAFALVDSAFLLLLGWLWYSVRLRDDPSFRPMTTPYIVGVFASAVLLGASAFLPGAARLVLWGFVVLGWLVGLTVLDRRGGLSQGTGAAVGESMIERFDLFTIIVLGEVVVGVVNGIADAGRSRIAVVTGILGLGIGFAYWWSYFDLVSARRLRSQRGARSRWLVGHLLVTMSIAATGAVMVGLLEHASDRHTPTTTAMVLALSVAVGVLALVVIATSLQDWVDLAPVYRRVSVALGLAALAALALGGLGLRPWLLILLLILDLWVVWVYGILTWFSFTHPEA